MKWRASLLAAIFCILSSGIIRAQEVHSTLRGIVSDATGAVVPDAAITVRNMDTGEFTNVRSNNNGEYSVPFLDPGRYEVTANRTGFKTYDHSGLVLETEQIVTENITLTVGEISETYTVSGQTPLIDTGDASTGQILTTEQVEDLPTNGGTPLGFARLEYGVVTKAKHSLGSASPVSNSTVDDFSLGGGNSSSNELLLNGVLNMQDGGRTAAFSPQLDSVDEIRVDVFGANTEYGDTSGGTVNMTTKGGSNQFHGSARWDYEDTGCSNVSGKFASRSANNCTWMSALPYQTPVGNNAPFGSHTNQLGGTIGGPVWIPHVFNGHNKLFFFYAYETYRGAPAAATTITSVPTAAERTGDFSALLPLASSTKTYQLYNPSIATGTQANYTRPAIAGNVFSNAGLSVSPIAQAYLKYVPLPNYNGVQTTADGEDNYFAYTPTLNDYRSHMGRMDWAIGGKDRLYGEAHRSRFLSSASDFFNTPLSGTISDTVYFGTQIDEVHQFTDTLFSEVRGSLTRTTTHSSLSSAGINPTSLGFPSYLAQDSTSLAIPRISFTDQTSPQAWSAAPGTPENYDALQLFGSVTKSWRAHTFLAGADIRAFKLSQIPTNSVNNYANGSFSFTNGKGNPVSASNTSNPAYFGSAFALFMLGIPSSGEEDINTPVQDNSFLQGFFVQDDWKMKSNLTISYGIRFEHETPVDESQNRMVNGFNTTAVNGVTAAAEANYTKAPNALLPAASFQPVGGAVYASANNRYAYSLAPVYYSPRVGIIWAPDFTQGKGVVRVGYGIYTNPYDDYNTGQTYGYNVANTYVPSANGGMTNNTLSNPFPTTAAANVAAVNPIAQPTGNTLGVNAQLGAKMVFYSPVIKVPYAERASLDLQYQIGNSIMVDLGYINNHAVHLTSSNTVDAIPLLPYLSHSPQYDVAVTNQMTGAAFKNGGPATTNVANPFKGLAGMTGTYATAALLAPYQYLQTYPQYLANNVTEQLIPNESSDYNALNARVAKTMGHGLTVNSVFEWSRQLGNQIQLNPGGPLSYGETSSDFPFHLAAYGTYLIPVGRGRQFFTNDNRIVDTFVGGWQFSPIYQFLSGNIISWGNAIYTGTGWNDFQNKQHDKSAVINGTPVFNTSVFNTLTCVNGGSTCQNDPTIAGYNPTVQPNAYNFRTFPQYLMRQDYTSNWDGNVQKNFDTWENVKVQLRLDVFNLLNRPQYNTPNVSPTSSLFGTDTGIYSGTTSRQFQLAAHVQF